MTERKAPAPLLLRAARGEKTERTPVWLMRQAGRVLPEYRKVREQAGSFKALLKNPEPACEVTLQPVDILGVDAAIIFSDILVVPEAMGLPYEVVEATGPVFGRTIQHEKDIAALKVAEPETDLSYVLDAIRLTKKELGGRVPLIGFAGAPWTIFCYMTEGRGSKTFSTARRWLYTRPEASHRLLQMITDSTIAYLRAQVEAGADIVQLFDSWAGVLGPQQYAAFSLAYLRKICEAVQDVPVIVFAKGASFAMQELGALPCAVIGLDWSTDIRQARALTTGKTLQGNMDPCLLYADFDTIRRETKLMLGAFGPQRHIANLGHGLYPDTEVDKVKCFVDAVKEHRWTGAC